MKSIKGISQEIISKLEHRTNKLGHGRSVAVIGFVDKEGLISDYTELVAGGISGIPFRQLLATVISDISGPLLAMINQLPENAVIITTSPGKTGIIINTGGINIFDLPVVKVGIKNGEFVDAGILYPEKSLFKLSSHSEKMELKNLAANSMAEEKDSLRELAKLRLKYLEISDQLPVKEIARSSAGQSSAPAAVNFDYEKQIKGLEKTFARQLVDKSISIEQGREVAAIGVINQAGYIEKAGEIIIGGMGYIPARLLLSGFKDIAEISLRKAYTEEIPEEAVIVHTHPGGTGVMHMGDAMAGPGTWGRPVVAIGHDQDGMIKGASIIVYNQDLAKLIDEYEKVGQEFFNAEIASEESAIRKKRYQIAQEFTDLCREIKIS